MNKLTNTKDYCMCINPIFEHESTQDKYIGFNCIECGKGLKEEVSMTFQELKEDLLNTIIVTSIFVLPSIIVIYLFLRFIIF